MEKIKLLTAPSSECAGCKNFRDGDCHPSRSHFFYEGEVDYDGIICLKRWGVIPASARFGLWGPFKVARFIFEGGHVSTPRSVLNKDPSGGYKTLVRQGERKNIPIPEEVDFSGAISRNSWEGYIHIPLIKRYIAGSCFPAVYVIVGLSEKAPKNFKKPQEMWNFFEERRIEGMEVDDAYEGRKSFFSSRPSMEVGEETNILVDICNGSV